MDEAELRNRYFLAGKKAGCPPDQMLNYWTARIFLHPKQLEFAAAAREADLPDGPDEIALGGARGTGKSLAALSQIAADDCRRFPGLKALLLRRQLKAAQESISDLKQKVFKNIPHSHDERANVIEFDNGSRLILGQYAKERDIDKYLGIEYDVVLIEESTSLSARAKSNIKASTRTSKVGWRPRTYHATNPGGIDHVGMKKKFVDPAMNGTQTKTRYIHCRVEDNTSLNPDYISTLDDLTGWQKAAWRFADWNISSGLYYSTFNPSIHVIDPFDIPSDWIAWGGFDYGFTHKNVFALLAKGGDGNTYVIGEYGEAKHLPEYHAEAIHALCNRMVGGISNLTTIKAGADVFFAKSSARTIAQDYSDLGIHLDRANTDRVTGASSILRGLGDPAAGKPPNLYIFKSCVGIIDALSRVEHDPARPEAVLKVDYDADSATDGDDFFDALRYAYIAESDFKTRKVARQPKFATRRFRC